MVYQLVMPFASAGFQIHANQTLAQKIVAGPMATVVIPGGRLYRQVGKPQFLVDRHLRPETRVARMLGGDIEPRVVAELAPARDRVEDPQALTRAHVERADVA